VPVLETRGISVRFGGVQALDDVSIVANDWEIVGIIGPNGAGKTTLLDCVSGFRRPDAGSVHLRGEDVSGLPVHARAALGLGRTFQEVGLVRSSTVLENVLTAMHLRAGYGLAAALVASPLSVSQERRMRREVAVILDMVDLSDHASSAVTELPFGLQKQVEIATTIGTGASILLLDEPSSGMSPEEEESVGTLLVRLRGELGLTIVMIDHHVPLVTRICDYVYCLSFGQVLAEGSPEEVRDHPDVVEAYLGEEDADAASGLRAGGAVEIPSETT
jgi:branched-chain amino acid transport system ATP-binding protein